MIVKQSVARPGQESCVTVVRSALEIAGLVISLLLIAVGGGLASDPVVLIVAAAGLSLSLMLAAFLERWWKPAPVQTT